MTKSPQDVYDDNSDDEIDDGTVPAKVEVQGSEALALAIQKDNPLLGLKPTFDSISFALSLFCARLSVVQTIWESDNSFIAYCIAFYPLSRDIAT
ncbi:hypothetical protein V1508DRAFT_400933, partial [Lipomyces doorenjongii]|uniref:uncharacterized protein n=1 Tax=Lipomyces doorenjongii TaxID=383834 RepID=UPI0034CD8903